MRFQFQPLLFLHVFAFLSLASAQPPYPVGNEFLVNTFTPGSQGRPSVDSDAEGNFVVVWWSISFRGFASLGQRYEKSGARLGTEFTISTDEPEFPRVAVGRDGRFVVVWMDLISSPGYHVFARRYDAQGAALGARFQVDTFTSVNLSQALDVDLDDSGNFVIAWEDYPQGLFGRRYASSGSPLGPPFPISEMQTKDLNVDELDLSVAPGGRFLLAWSVAPQQGSENEIFAQRFAANGSELGTAFQVNTETYRSQSSPSVAFDASGGFLIVWEDTLQGIRGQRFSNQSARLGGEFEISGPKGSSRDPRVRIDPEGRSTVVWMETDSESQDKEIQGRRFQSSGQAMGESFTINVFNDGPQEPPALALLPDQDFVVAWQSNPLSELGADGEGSGILGQVLSYDPVPTPAQSPTPLPTATPTATLPVSAGPEFPVHSDVKDAQYDPAIGIAGDGSFVTAWLGADESQSGIFAQRFSPLGEKQGPEFQVNTNYVGMQFQPAVGRAASGDFLIVWTGGTQGDDSVFGQSFGADGQPLGQELQLDSCSTCRGLFPSVAAAGTGWVTAWGGNSSIQGRRFGSDGTPLGASFEVGLANSYLEYPRLAANDLGQFLVVWAVAGPAPEGVRARRFDASGVAIGGEVFLPVQTVNDLRSDAILGEDGSFSVVWSSPAGPQDDGDIQLQRFDAQGLAQGAAFQVNTYTTGSQRNPRIARDGDGRFVVTWDQDRDQDGSFLGVFARAFEADASPRGLDFQVNLSTLLRQRQPDVAMNDAGRFVVAWESEILGSEYGFVFMRPFSLNQETLEVLAGPGLLALLAVPALGLLVLLRRRRS